MTHPVLEMPIYVFTCMNDPDQPALAIIGDLPMRFRGATPMKARKAADEWRKAEVAKEEAKRAAAEKRQAALAKAREAKKAAKESAE